METTSLSSVLATTKGTITQPELRLHGVRTPLTFRIGTLKRYLKETFCLSFPFLRSPGAFYIFFFLFSTLKSVYACLCVWRWWWGGGLLSDFSPCHHLLPHCFNFIDSGSDCVFRSYTRVKDNLSSECLFHSNGGKVEPRARAILCTVQRDKIQR